MQQAAQRQPTPPGTPGSAAPGFPRAFSTTSMASVVVNEAEPEAEAGLPHKPFGGVLRSIKVGREKSSRSPHVT